MHHHDDGAKLRERKDSFSSGTHEVCVWGAGGGGGRCLLRQGAMGLVPELPVPPPVRHVCADRQPPLLPEHLLDQLSAGDVHHHHGAVGGLPKRTVDLTLLHLSGHSELKVTPALYTKV